MATKQSNTPSLSLPKTVTVRGIGISRLPLGGYLSAIQLLQDLPGDLLAACFPGEDFAGVLARLRTLDVALLQSVCGKALVIAPRQVLGAVARLTGAPEERLLSDPDIGLDGLVELLSAFVEVNRLADFIPAIRRLMDQARMATGSPRQPSGSNG